MRPEEIEVPPTPTPIVSTGFFAWIWSKCQALAGWFYPTIEGYSRDEADLLMQRHMEHRSWFDKISAAWYNQSFLLKITYAFLFIAASGLVGMLVGSSLICTVAGIFLSFLTHKLLVAHEQNRWEAIRITAAEIVALEADLQASNDFFNEATTTINNTQEALSVEVDAMQQQVALLAPEIPLLQQQNEMLAFVVEAVENETSSVVQKQKEVHDELIVITEDLDQFHTQLDHTKNVVKGIEEAALGFSEAVTVIEGSQLKLADAVDKISFFATQRPPAKTFISTHDGFINDLMKEIEANQLLMDEMIAEEPGTSMRIH